MRIDPERFWQQRDNWPLDIGGYVFLGRAVLQVAKAQLEPPEPMTLPFSNRAQRTYDLAIERVAQEAAAGRLKTVTLRGAQLMPMALAEWATLDRKTVFRCFFRIPGKVYRMGSYGESAWPIYVEAKSLAQFVAWTACAAKAAEADVAFARVAADRYTIENQPDMLPPKNFTSVDEAISTILHDDEATGDGKNHLRRLLRSGKTEAILQFWETGNIEGIAASFWETGEAISALSDNGVVAIPEPGPGTDYSRRAYVRIRKMAVVDFDSNASRNATEVRGSAEAVIANCDRQKAARLTKSEQQALTALIGAFGESGGNRKPPRDRAARASAWANKQTPRAPLPGDLPRTIARLDQKINWPQPSDKPS